jgi:aspartate/methionine/tyrosine aminotransferase
MNGMSFAHELLDTEKIAVMPGESFGAVSYTHLTLPTIA